MRRLWKAGERALCQYGVAEVLRVESEPRGRRYGRYTIRVLGNRYIKQVENYPGYWLKELE